MRTQQNRRCTPIAGVGLAVAFLSACGGVSSPSTNRVENFPGTLQLLQAQTYNFTSGGTGEFEVTLTDFSAGSITFIGTAYGQQTGAGCTQIQKNEFTRVNQPALGGPISSGRFCVAIYDYGTLVAPATYNLRVSHP